MKTGAVVERQLDERKSDFTRINDNYACQKTRYVYSARFDETREVTFDALLKYDCETGNTEEHTFGQGVYCGEAVFAPKVGAVDEDDGYLITFIRNEIAGESECVVVDAKDFEADPVARIKIPHRVPYGFHAGWVGT